ncbi:MAG: Calx-beta domain-containing protein, partial [Acidimicrobiales bacterium]
MFSDTQNRTVKGVDFKGTLTITGNRELRIGTTSANAASTVYDLVLSGRRGGAAQLTVTGSLTVNAGAILGSPASATAGYGGSTVVAAGATATIGAAVTIESGHTLRNEGVTSWTAGDVTLCAASSIVNAGSFQLPDNPFYTVVECDGGEGDVSFVNESAGTATKGATATEGALYVPFANDGHVIVQGGSLLLTDQPAGDPDTGDIQVSPGATIELCGDRAFSTGAGISGGGLVKVSCGYIELGPIDTLPALEFAGGEIVGNLTITQSLAWGFGLFSGPGTTTIGPSATATGGYFLDGHTLVNEGSWSLGGGALSICAGSTVENRGSLDLGTGIGSISNCGDPTGVLMNAATGTITTSAGATTTILPVTTNHGSVEIASGSELRISGDLTNLSGGILSGGSYHVAGTLRFDETGTGGITSNGSLMALLAPGASVTNAVGVDALRTLAVNLPAGALELSGGRQQTVSAALTNRGSIRVDAGSRLALTGGGTLELDGGTLAGSGTVQAGLVRNAGRIEPGSGGPGTLVVDGGFTQTAAGTLAVDLDGAIPGTQHDVLAVTGAVSLAGGLELDRGYAPLDGDTYQVLTGSAVTGAFSSVTGDDAGGGLTFVPIYDATNVIVLATSSPVIVIEDSARPEGDTGSSLLTFNLSLSKPSASTVTVQLDTVDVTATAGDDYQPRSTVVSFAPSQTTATVEVTIIGDTAYEHDETFEVLLSSASGGVIGDPEAIGTIVNDDPMPTISIDDVTVLEGDSGTRPATFTVSLSSPSPDEVTVGFATVDATAMAPGDYLTTAGTLTFAPGDTSKVLTVEVVGDRWFEGDEAFVVDLLAPTGATIGDGQGTGTIVDDEPTPSLAIDDVTVVEGDSGTTAAVFTVTLTPASQSTVTVELATADGTAIAPGDYGAV